MNDIDREAVIAVLAGEASVEEARRVIKWKAASPKNREMYARLESFWNATERVSPGPNEAPPPSPKAIIELARGRRVGGDAAAAAKGLKIGRLPGRQEQTPGWTSSRSWLAIPAGIAAALVIGLGVGIGVFGSGETAGFGPDSFVTGDGEVATVTLEDETVVRIAPNSRLVFSGDGSNREVSLFGRAYFAVSRNEERPFRVRLPGGDVEVLGTRFDVEGRGRGIQVAVVEGQVRLDAAGARLSVYANQIGRLVEGKSPALEDVEDVYRVIDWLGRFLVFESTPMTDVAAEFEGRFDMEIEIRDPELRNRTITGWFAGQSPDEMIDGICRVIDARCAIQNDAVVMEMGS